MTTTEIITYALAGLGALVSAASIASTFVPPQSTLGLWLAWFASMPIRHVPKKPKGETVAKVTTALLVLLLSGCAGTLDNARGAARIQYVGPVTVAYPGGKPVSLGVAARDNRRCETLSDRSYWFGVGAAASGSTGAGAVIAVIPTSERYETPLLIAGAVAASISVVSTLAASKASEVYTREGCAQK